MKELLTRSASVNQLAIFIAAEVFNIAIDVYYPLVHGKTSIFDSKRKSVTYNDNGKFAKRVNVIWCSTFGVHQELPSNWNPTANMHYKEAYINHFEPLVEREKIDDKKSGK